MSCSIAMNAAGAKPSVSAFDIAPWLKTPEMKEQEWKQQERDNLVEEMTLVADAYERSKVNAD